MRFILATVLYAALAVAANADTSGLNDLREGTLRKLQFHAEPRPVPAAVLLDAEDGEHDMSEYSGKYVLLNFWATWCAPCRHEMPSLDRLQAEMGSDDFEVVTVATGRNPVPSITRFFDEIEVAHLPILRDPSQGFARSMAVMGLPLTVLIDPDGQEIGRLIGDAEWDSDSAKAIINALTVGS